MKTFWEVAAVIMTGIGVAVAAVLMFVFAIAVGLGVAALIYGPLGYVGALAWNEIALQYIDAKPVVWYHVSILLYVIAVISRIVFCRDKPNVKIKCNPPSSSSFVRTR
ncbi:MAG: hypothetical protein E6Q97_00485 [Desulfurellales bacterium]|nr:MAG: hypothetical protein E6Q97_00485 [Desulfurellales bacterium]